MLRNYFIPNNIRCGVERKRQAEKSAAQTLRPPKQGLPSRFVFSPLAFSFR